MKYDFFVLSFVLKYKNLLSILTINIYIYSNFNAQFQDFKVRRLKPG